MLRIPMPIRWALKRIEQAEEEETDGIISSLIKCYGRLHPEYELVVLSLPKKSWEERNAEIDRIAECLKKEYTWEHIKV